MGAPPDATLCVRCRVRPVDPKWRPFCSERCKLIDLGDWLRERHRIPDGSIPVDEDVPDDREDR